MHSFIKFSATPKYRHCLMLLFHAFLGWLCKMLRDPRYPDKPDMGREDSFQETDGEVEPEGEDGSGDLHPPVSATQACGWLPQLL